MKILLRIAMHFFIVLLFIPLAGFSYPGEILKLFDSPGHFSTGLTFDGKYLWMADRKTDLFYKINPADGKVVSTLETPGYWPTGLAWDGNYLWNADLKGGQDVEEDHNGVIYKIDPESGTVLKTLVAPSASPIGLTWDGTYLWCVDNRSDMIIQFSPEDGTTIRSFRSPSSDSRGLTFDGKYLWVSDRNRDEIYMVNPETGYVVLIMQSPAPYPRGLCFDGEYLWNIDFETDKLYQLKIRDDEKFIRLNERTGKVVYTQQVKNFGPGKVLTADLHLAIPVNRNNQELLSEIEYNIEPTEFVTDKWGQKTAHYHFMNIPAGETRTVEMTVKARTYDVRYFIFPDQVGTLEDIPQDLKDKYLEDNDKFQIDHPVIREAVSRVVGNEENPYWIMRKIFNHIIANMYYEMSGGWNTAPTVLARGNGSCSEYTFVFISMCRAAGLPARYVGSVVVRGDDASMDDVFHRWAEVYLPNYGWIPVDGSRGDSDWPRNQAIAIGNVNGKLLITTQSGGGSETMEWTYNSNAFWTTEPKTYVNWEHFGDWMPAEVEN